MPQPSTLRLICNAAAASPTLLFNDWQDAARLKRNESHWLRCDGAENSGEKRNVLVVSALLPLAIHLARLCKLQRRVHVLRVC
jgi:hypothetical protein